MKNSLIVVPWDFSEYARATLQYAFENHAPDDIYVICVLERPNPYAFGTDWEPEAEARTRQRCVDKFFDSFEPARESGVQFESRFGEPAAQIVRFADEIGADSIIMSTHGRTGISRMIMGSVTQRVIARANCPVVVIPGRCAENLDEA